MNDAVIAPVEMIELNRKVEKLGITPDRFKAMATRVRTGQKSPADAPPEKNAPLP